jgi:hypothetical protein
MKSPHIEQLHQECVETLKYLITQANRTCSILEAMTEFPITSDIWHSAVEQRVRENQAQAEYQQARERLFNEIRRSQQA